jgi:hypothetical protein
MGNTIKNILWGVITTFVFVGALEAATTNMNELHSILIDTFNNPQNREWVEEGVTKVEPRTWTVRGSMHSTEGTPELRYIEGGPNKRSYVNNSQGQQILGVRSKFNYRGYNYFEVTPVTGDQVGFALPGNVRALSVWVWGSNYDYSLEAQFSDHNGKVYVIPMGSLRFIGWRNLTINIPERYTQDKYNPWGGSLRFLRFVVRTAPTERVHDFQIYFDDINVLTVKDQSPYGGGELFDPERINAIWANGQ